MAPSSDAPGESASPSANPASSGVPLTAGTPAQPAAPKRRGIGQLFSAIWAMLSWFIRLPLLPFRPRHTDIEEITVYSAHASFFLWLPIMTGFICAALVRWHPDWSGTIGWFYLWVVVYFIVTLLYDFSTKKLALWVGIFLLIWLTSKYVEHVQNIALLGWLISYLANLDPKLDPGFATVMSWLLLLPWFGSLLQMALNGRKTFSPNEISESYFGEGNELTDRMGLRFRTKYRDLLESVLSFGGGDIQAVDNQQNVIKHWDNILGLYFVWNDLDRILSQRASLIEKSNDGKQESRG